MWEKIKYWAGLEKYSPFVKDYSEKANFSAVIYMAVIVVILEVYVIASVTLNVLTSGKQRTIEWIISHYAGYVTLTVTGLIMLWFSIGYLKGKNKNLALGHGILYVFCFVCVAFGMYISSMDYAKGEQILTFLTMIIFVFCLLVWRPYISFLLLAVAMLIFLYVMNKSVPLSFATSLNMFVYFISAFMVSVNSYRQRMVDAHSAEHLHLAYEELEKVSITDLLTGVSNYTNFVDHSSELLRADPEHVSEYSFLFLNLIDFKAYNQKHGYEQGDILLMGMAKRLQDVFPGDFIGRVSDDHFCILTKDPEAEAKIIELDRLLEAEHPLSRLGLTCGAYHPKNEECNVARACDHARYACSTLNKQFRKRFAYYDEKMDEDFRRRQYIVNNVDKAIENGYIRPFYQPVVFSDDFKMCGVEALARWIDPVYGFLSPGAFIPVLEEYNQIHKLDLCIMRNVCKDLRDMLDKGMHTVPCSINFSRRDFENTDIYAELEKVVEQYQVPRNALHIEITESALTENDEELKEVTEKLRSAGYEVWLDDFGSGYSSLNVLKDYRFNVMKIDMVFLKNFNGNVRTKVLLQSIVNLANIMEMSTLTEGVETLEQADFLKEIGCKKLQGYYFGKPMALPELLDTVKSGKLKLSRAA